MSEGKGGRKRRRSASGGPRKEGENRRRYEPRGAREHRAPEFEKSKDDRRRRSPEWREKGDPDSRQIHVTVDMKECRPTLPLLTADDIAELFAQWHEDIESINMVPPEQKEQGAQEATEDGALPIPTPQLPDTRITFVLEAASPDAYKKLVRWARLEAAAHRLQIRFAPVTIKPLGRVNLNESLAGLYPPINIVAFNPTEGRRFRISSDELYISEGAVSCIEECMRGGEMPKRAFCPWFRNDLPCKFGEQCNFVHPYSSAKMTRVRRSRPRRIYTAADLIKLPEFPPQHPCQIQYGSCRWGARCRWTKFHGQICAQWLKRGGVCPRVEKGQSCKWIHAIVGDDSLWADEDDSSFESESAISESEDELQTDCLDDAHFEDTLLMRDHGASSAGCGKMTSRDFRSMWCEIDGFHKSQLYKGQKGHTYGENFGVVAFKGPEAAVDALLQTVGCLVNVSFYGVEEMLKHAAMMQPQQDED